MDKELHLKIELAEDLTENEQDEFWGELLEEIESMNLYAGGGTNFNSLDWIIDYSNSKQTKGEIIDNIANFLMVKDVLVLNFSIK